MALAIRGRTRRPVLRPQVPETDEAVDLVFAGLSRQSRFLRFHTPVPRLTGAMRTGLLAVDGRTHVGLVAEVAGRPVGIGRFVDRGPGHVDLAVAVVDAAQGRGVGRRLLEALGERARELGHPALYGDVLRENLRIQRLLRSVFPGSTMRWVDGVLRMTCPLDGPDGLSDEEILAELLS